MQGLPRLCLNTCLYSSFLVCISGLAVDLALASQLQLNPQPPSPPEVLEGEIPTTIEVSRFRVLGSTVFSEAELVEVTAPFTNRPLSFVQLLQARTAVTQLYLDRGYITSGAFLPPQTFQDRGEVVLEVIEGKLADIEVKGNTRLQADYIKQQVAAAASPPLNRDRLVNALQLLQLNPLIASISAELVSSPEPGANQLIVTIQETPSFKLKAGLDNLRSPAVGSDRQVVELVENNLLGWSDRLALGYSRSAGSNSYDLSYSFPLTAANTSISFSFNHVNSRIIEAPFSQVDLIAGARNYDLSLRHPLWQSPNQELVMGVTASHRQSDTAVLDTPLAIAPGADSQGRTRISALRWFQEYNLRQSSQLLALRSQLSWGIGVLGATLNPEPPDSQFFTWRGQAQYLNQLAADTLLVVRADLQLSDRPLVPIEQIGIGGQSSVRGYRQDLFLGDNGATFNTELRLPIWKTAQSLVQLIPFTDFGIAWNSGSNANSIMGIGVGLSWQHNQNLAIRLDYGIPLNGKSGSSLQEQGIYFSLNWQIF